MLLITLNMTHSFKCPLLIWLALLWLLFQPARSCTVPNLSKKVLFLTSSYPHPEAAFIHFKYQVLVIHSFKGGFTMLSALSSTLWFDPRSLDCSGKIIFLQDCTGPPHLSLQSWHTSPQATPLSLLTSLFSLKRCRYCSPLSLLHLLLELVFSHTVAK